jgi:transcriptional regulator with GAF, ATPase, and Fis domain
MSPERAERRQRVLEALEKTVWNQTRAAEVLGIARRTLQTWMIDLDIPRPRTGAR